MMVKDSVIKVENLWKRYGLPLPGFIREGQRWCLQFLSTDSRQSTAGLNGLEDGSFALKDVSFEVERGEILGVIGRNGAGKSTLLKVLAGVTPPTRGRVELRGPVFPMIELNAGLHPELTGRENVRLLGAIMGISREEIEEKVPIIAEFTELREWFERPVRTYSSGMLARLGFAVAMHVEADVLLVDEVFAVGDLGFQKKCYDKMSKLQNLGKTFIVVSHSPYQLERMCSRILLLEDGRRVALLDPREVITAYFEIVNRGVLIPGDIELESNDEGGSCNRPGTGAIRITNVALMGDDGRVTKRVEAMQPMQVIIDFTAFEAVSGCLFSIRIFSTTNTAVTYLNTTMITEQKTFRGKHRLTCTIPKVLLMSDTYSLEIKVASNVLLDLVHYAAPFKVVLTDPDAIHLSGNKGIFLTEAEWTLD